jgi:hypothetical protein
MLVEIVGASSARTSQFVIVIKTKRMAVTMAFLERMSVGLGDILGFVAVNSMSFDAVMVKVKARAGFGINEDDGRRKSTGGGE